MNQKTYINNFNKILESGFNNYITFVYTIVVYERIKYQIKN